jgi:hypothetical protein
LVTPSENQKTIYTHCCVIGSTTKTSAMCNKNYVVANLVRGGLFQGEGDKEKR